MAIFMGLENILTTPLSSLSNEQADLLNKFTSYKDKADELSESVPRSLRELQDNFFQKIQDNLDKVESPKKDIDAIKSIYMQTLHNGIEKAASMTSDALEKPASAIRNFNILENYVSVLESILEFKQGIDKDFPGLSDTITTIAAPLIIGIISIFNPVAALSLQTSQILQKTAGFLQTENLEKTIDRINSRIESVGEDKKLSYLFSLADEMSKISEHANIDPHSLNKLGLNINGLDKTIKEISSDGHSAELIKDICQYVDKYIPQTEKEIDRKLESLKNKTIESLRENGASKEAISEVESILNNAQIKSKDEMENVLSSGNKVFDNITSLQKSADILEQTEKAMIHSVVKNHPNSKDAIIAASEVLKKDISSNIRGDINKIATKITKDMKNKSFAKETLGVNLAAEITLKKSLQNRSLSK